MNEFSNNLTPGADEPTAPPASPQELQDAELLNSMIDALRAGKSPDDLCIGSAGRTVVRLHTHTSSAEIDSSFQNGLEKQLVRRFSEKAPKRRWKFWTLVGVPTATLAVAVLGIVATMKPDVFQQQAPTNTAVAQGGESANTNTAASTNINAETGDEIASSEKSAQSETPETVKELFPSVNAELVSVEPELSDLTDIKNELENTMGELEALIQDIEELENMTTESDDVDQLLKDIETLSI